MSRTLTTLALALGLGVAGLASGKVSSSTAPSTEPTTGPSVEAQAANQRPQIEVCFVLDTTGSMSGLIEGAKRKIWSIANTIIAVKDKPRIKMALIGYRDKNDAYVTKVFDLTDDIDTVFKNLQGFGADGGGDTPESVNQALNEAVTKVSWSPDKAVTKIIFLVGDAPPHMDYADDVKYQETCQAAVKKNLIINTVQCGTESSTAPVWKEIAHLSEGAYIPLSQSGGEMVAIAAPQDKELAELNAKVNGTIVLYGHDRDRDGVMEKIALGGSGPTTSSASLDRLAYNAADGKAVQGRGDLVNDSALGTAKLEQLKDADLPEVMKKMTPEQRKEYLNKQAQERQQLQKRVIELSKARNEFFAGEKKKLAGSTRADAFDEQVSGVVQKQYESNSHK